MENLITCKVCGKQSTRIYGAHLKKHGLTSEEYLKLYPGSPLYTESDNKQTTKNSGKHMKQEKYRKMFSEKIRGENNPNSKAKTTEEERKSRSPFSKNFIKYKNENEVLNFSMKVQKEITPEKRPNRIEYWLNKGYSYVEAEKQLTNRQKTFSLKKCIEKYGEEKGREIFSDRQKKWQKSLNENGNLKHGFSRSSQILFYDILEKTKDNSLAYDICEALGKINDTSSFVHLLRITQGRFLNTVKAKAQESIAAIDWKKKSVFEDGQAN